MRHPLVLVLCALSAACASSAVQMPQPPAPEQGAFIVLLGADTVAVERFTRTDGMLEGDLLTRSPRGRLVHYRATLGEGGRVTRLEAQGRPLANVPGASRPQSTTIVFEPDTARVQIVVGDSTRTATMPVSADLALPWFASYALYEQAVRRARAIGGDSVGIELVAPGQRQSLTMPVVRRGADTVGIDYFGSPMLARVDAAGRMLSVDGSLTTNKVQVQRLPTVDIEGLARRYAAADSAGQALGQLSPRDSLAAAVGAADVRINYGRPTRRGRTIFGTVVPWEQVWRTGANAATSFTTSADVMVGGTLVPAGSYTLFTLPSPSGTKLIINKQTGQWGTVYDASRDHARVDLQSETLSSPVEQFTIEMIPQGQGAVMQLSWDRTRFSVPITPK